MVGYALAALLAAAACSDPALTSDTLVVTVASTAPVDTAVPTSTVPAVPRVFAVGDSTLLAAEYYDTMAGFAGMDLVYDAKSCRTVGIPSCGPRPIPTNTVQSIADADGAVRRRRRHGRLRRVVDDVPGQLRRRGRQRLAPPGRPTWCG